MDPQQLQTQVAQPAQGVFPARSTAGMPAIHDVSPMDRPWHTIYAVAAVFIALIALFIAYFLDVRYIAQAKRDATTIDSILVALQDPALQETQEQVTRYASAISGYQISAAKQHDYSKLLSEIDQRLPKEALLDSIGIDDKGTIRIVGRTPSFELAAKTFESYKTSTYITNVVLADVSMSDKQDTQQINFTISGTIKMINNTAASAAGESEGL
jgi:hypothetical protein